MEIRSYPIWLSLFILFGPFLMISWTGFKSYSVVWVAPILGAGMLVLALFYLSKRLHEHMEEIAALRQLLQTNKTATVSKTVNASELNQRLS